MSPRSHRLLHALVLALTACHRPAPPAGERADLRAADNLRAAADLRAADNLRAAADLRAADNLRAAADLRAAERPSPPPATATCGQTANCSRGCPVQGLAQCVAACESRVSTDGRPYWAALQRCSGDFCLDPCASPTALSCKLCVMSHCASQAAACLSH